MKKILAILLLAPAIAFANTAQQQIDCLTEAVYFESRSESLIGQISVALVVMNRVHDTLDRWYNDVCKVVHQPAQFSYYWDGKPEIYKDKAAKERARLVAEMVFFGTVIDFTEGATLYHTLDSLPKWDWSKIKRVTTIDNHIFYKDR